MLTVSVRRCCLVLLASLGVGFLFVTDYLNPRVDGQRLSVWFERSLLQNYTVVPREDAEPFRRVGPRGAKWLARELHQAPPLLERAHVFVYSHVGHWVGMPPPAGPSQDPRIQLARRLLGHLNPAVTGPILVECFQSCCANDKPVLAETLGELGPEAADLVGPCLVSALRSTNSAELAGVILSLGEVLYRPEDVVPKLVPLLAHSDSQVRIEASYTLGSYAADPASTLRPLIERLSDSDRVVKANAARALGRMKSGARPAVEPLLVALRGGTERTPIMARSLEALSSIAPEVLRSATAEIDEWVGTKVPEDSYFRVMAGTAKERLGTRAPTLTADCLALMQSPKAYIRWEALERLGECGTGGRAVREVLEGRLSDPNGLVRRTAQQALEQWDSRHRAAQGAEKITLPSERTQE